MQPQLETARLTLTPALIDEFEDCVRYWTDPAIPWRNGLVPDRESCWTRFLKNHGHWQLLGFGLWMIREKGGSTPIGEVGFVTSNRETTPRFGSEPEFGIALIPSAHKKGFALEAASAALSWSASTWPGEDTICMTSTTNASSLRLLHKLHYQREGIGSYHNEPVFFLRRRCAG
jgi:RimJ/RimL family protein N-acetyltransferase